MSKKLYYNGKMVGEIVTLSDGIRIFYKSIKGSIHFLRKPEPSIAYNIEVLEQLPEIDFLKVYDKETQATYIIKFTEFLNSSKYTNRGHGIQRYLPLREWDIDI